MRSPTVDFGGLLRAFAEPGVDFVVIGGVSAALQGVPTMTYDLDLVLGPGEENLDRAFLVLQELEASFREQLPKLLLPKRSDLGGRGAMLLITRLGPLDILGELATGWGYSDLMSRVESFRSAEGYEIKILKLEALIEVKELVGREKDLAALPMYRQALRKRDSGKP